MQRFTFNELELWEQTRGVASAGRFTHKIRASRVKADASVVEGPSGIEIAHAILVAAVGRRTPVSQFEDAGGVAARPLVRLFGLRHSTCSFDCCQFMQTLDLHGAGNEPEFHFRRRGYWAL